MGAGLGARRPNERSGGRRARVSLKRALLPQPQPLALLLDEPFSKLGAALRERMHEQTRQAVLVTHDPQDIPPGATLVRLSDA